MKRVVLDSNGERIPGLFRDSSGALIVDDQRSLAKYKSQQSKEKELVELRSKVEELSSMMVQIKEMMERNNNG